METMIVKKWNFQLLLQFVWSHDTILANETQIGASSILSQNERQSLPKRKKCLILTFLLLVWDMDVRPGVAAAILQTCSVEHGIREGRPERENDSLLQHHGASVPSRDCSSVDCSCGKLPSSVFCNVLQKGFPTNTQSDVAMN